jgi:hypothetical protein
MHVPMTGQHPGLDHDHVIVAVERTPLKVC